MELNEAKKILNVVSNVAILIMGAKYAYNEYLIWRENRYMQQAMCETCNDSIYTTNSNIILPMQTNDTSYFKFSDAALDCILRYGPLLEACAGAGEFRKSMTAHLARTNSTQTFDCISYDRIANLESNVIEGLNGTFEHKYPDRTLCIFCGFNTVASVLNYTGKRLILGGYLHRNNRDPTIDLETHKIIQRSAILDLRPDPLWLNNNGWSEKESIHWLCPISSLTIDKQCQYRSYLQTQTMYIIKVYERS